MLELNRNNLKESKKHLTIEKIKIEDFELDLETIKNSEKIIFKDGQQTKQLKSRVVEN